jgi:hypothetical protein
LPSGVFVLENASGCELEDFGRKNSQASRHEKIPPQASGVFRTRSPICSYGIFASAPVESAF